MWNEHVAMTNDECGVSGNEFSSKKQIRTIEACSPVEIDVQPQRKTLKASACGNFMEWFDFTLYGFFAMAIGANFFPAPAHQLGRPSNTGPASCWGDLWRVACPRP
jgi:hypothetical protein